MTTIQCPKCAQGAFMVLIEKTLVHEVYKCPNCEHKRVIAYAVFKYKLS